MAFPSVTNTFINGATSDASQINQNFSDILSGFSDSTKDFSMANGTLSGTLTANGNLTIGSSSSKTVNFLGSLISSIPVSGNALWDLGGTLLGFKSIYLGSTSTFTTRILAGATASWTLTLPATAGSNLQVLTTDGTGASSWQPLYNDPTARQNYGLSTTVASNALTINLLAANGGTPSATNPVNINFRNATATTGTPSFVQCTSALSVTVPSGATLGTTNGVTSNLYIYAINNAGAMELGICGNNYGFDEGSIQNTTNLTAGSATPGILYSTVGRTGIAVRLLGRIKINEATAGTWASNATEVASGTFAPNATFFASTSVTTTNTAISSTTFLTASNSPAFTFTPAITGTYKVYCMPPIYAGTASTQAMGRIVNTTGSATLLFEAAAIVYGNSGDHMSSVPMQSIYTLTGGTLYVFDIQGKVDANAMLFHGSVIPFYMFAELIN